LSIATKDTKGSFPPREPQSPRVSVTYYSDRYYRAFIVCLGRNKLSGVRRCTGGREKFIRGVTTVTSVFIGSLPLFFLIQFNFFRWNGRDTINVLFFPGGTAPHAILGSENAHSLTNKTHE